MSHTTHLRRTAGTAGATALLGLALATPALAAQDPATGGWTSATTAATAATTDQNGIERARQLGGYTYSQELSTLRQGTAPRQQPAPTIVLREYDGVEYVQVGIGLLAGLALAGGAAALSRRQHRHPHPA